MVVGDRIELATVTGLAQDNQGKPVAFKINGIAADKLCVVSDAGDHYEFMLCNLIYIRRIDNA